LSLLNRPLWTNQRKIVDRWLLAPESAYGPCAQEARFAQSGGLSGISPLTKSRRTSAD
jgi:hypothetical protein